MQLTNTKQILLEKEEEKLTVVKRIESSLERIESHMQRIGDMLQNLPEMIANQKAMLSALTQPHMHPFHSQDHLLRHPTLRVSLQDLSIFQVPVIINYYLCSLCNLDDFR